MFSDKEVKVIAELTANGIIPYSASFNITESILSDYICAYDRLFTKTSGVGDTSNKRYARKLAGRTLLKLKQSLGASISDCREGIVYLIENEAFPEHYKVGMTNDLAMRLRSYQTYDPLKRFKVKHYEFVLNKRSVEKKVLNSMHVKIENGEWIRKLDSNLFLSLVKE